MRAHALALSLALSLALPASTQAQHDDDSAAAVAASDAYAPPSGDRPTSGDASLLSGRTLGVGNVMIAAMAGWPGGYVQLELAPTSLFNIGIRGGFLWGSPMMGLQVGLGGELAVPMRLRIWGEHQTDLAIVLEPMFAVGPGNLYGEAALGGQFAYGTRLDAGARIGWEADPHLTVFGGITAGGGFSEVPQPRSSIQPIGVVYATLGAEVLTSRDFLLFLRLDAGYGLAPDRSGLALYGDRAFLRIVFGGAFLL
jgi:hypothetical protein